MPIPKRFQPKPASDELVRQMGELCASIENATGTEDEQPLLDHWHEHATRLYEPHEFASYWKNTDQETFVREALHSQSGPYSCGLALQEAEEVFE